jgi:hypothetical protein
MRSPAPSSRKGGVTGIFKDMFGAKKEAEGGEYRRLDGEGDDV